MSKTVVPVESSISKAKRIVAQEYGKISIKSGGKISVEKDNDGKTPKLIIKRFR